MEITKPAKNRPLKALFYGPPGSGKTKLGGSGPKPLIIDMEQGSMTLRDTDVDIVQPTKWSEIVEIWKSLAGGVWKHETVTLDTVSMMQEISSWDTPLLADFKAGTDPRNSYGRLGATMRDMLWKFALLPINVIFLAQLRIEEDDPQRKNKPEEGTFPLAPDVTPSIAKVLTAAPDVIGRTFVRNTPNGPVYGVSFGPEPRSVAKQRALGLPSEVSNLTITKLIDKINGGNKE